MITPETLIEKLMEDKPEETDVILHLFQFYREENPDKDVGQFLLEITNTSLSSDELFGQVPEEREYRFVCEGIGLLKTAVSKRGMDFNTTVIDYLDMDNFAKSFIREFYTHVREILCEYILEKYKNETIKANTILRQILKTN